MNHLNDLNGKKKHIRLYRCSGIDGVEEAADAAALDDVDVGVGVGLLLTDGPAALSVSMVGWEWDDEAEGREEADMEYGTLELGSSSSSMLLLTDSALILTFAALSTSIAATSGGRSSRAPGGGGK